MKAIINGKRYNTETAIKVADHSNGVPTSDFSHVYEVLYQTKAGAWFLHGEGGGLSSYARSCGQNAWCGGSAIIPMTRAEAQAWLEEHQEHDALEVHFGSEIEDA